MVVGLAGLPQAVIAQDDPELDIGGAMRWNYLYQSWDAKEDNQNKGGEWALDTYRINVDGSYKDVYLSAEYRFYAGYHFIHHGYFGYDFTEDTKFHFGVNQAPFGITPYASHNWFFQLPYYVGLEDDYEAGLKLMQNFGESLKLDVAYYLNSEGSYTGNSTASARYSYDVVPSDSAATAYFGSQFAGGTSRSTYQVENNQVNVRARYYLGEQEFGVSGQFGQLYNSALNENGSRYAWGVHANLNFANFNFKGEVIGYEFSPEVAPGQSDEFVIMGAYDAPYAVASKAMFYVAGLAYSLPVEIGPISNLTFYENYTYMMKDNDNFADSQNAITGVMVTAGNIYTYVDFAMGQNHPWIGPSYGTGLARAVTDPDWHYRFNINMGYYF